MAQYSRMFYRDTIHVGVPAGAEATINDPINNAIGLWDLLRTTQAWGKQVLGSSRRAILDPCHCCLQQYDQTSIAVHL